MAPEKSFIAAYMVTADGRAIYKFGLVEQQHIVPVRQYFHQFFAVHLLPPYAEQFGAEFHHLAIGNTDLGDNAVGISTYLVH